MSKRLGGTIGCKDKNSVWILFGFPNGNSISVNRLLPREVAQAVMVPTTLVSSWIGDVGKEPPRDESVIFVLLGRAIPKHDWKPSQHAYVPGIPFRDNHCSTDVLSTVLPLFCISSV